MGLDMYLSARKFYWSDDQAPSDPDVPEGFKVDYLIVEAVYWRKANAIHKWFVDNVQDGEDECRAHYVSRPQLAELRDLCAKVAADPAKLGPELLPTQSGFFFGETDYDEWYGEYVADTVSKINKVLDPTVFDPKIWEFEYRSSW